MTVAPSTRDREPSAGASPRLRVALVWLLRLDALALTTAFVAIFLTRDFMAASHRELGLGEMPMTPLVDYLTRSLALMYATRGLFVWLAASDVDRYRPLVSLIGASNVLIGLTLLGIDLVAGMPNFWTGFEGPPIALVGIAILWLARKAPVTSV